MANKIVLWIDDMDEWTDSAQYNLNTMIDSDIHKLSIVHRKNGENIAQEIMQFNFDLILMDYHMEPFNGDKYISDVRMEEQLEFIPIIFYTIDLTVDLASLVVDKKNVEVCHRTELLGVVYQRLFPV